MIPISGQSAFVFCAVFALAAFQAFCGTDDVRAQESPQPSESRFYFNDTDDCLRCHSNSREMRDSAKFIGTAPAEIWEKLDKHSQSFLLLKGKSRELTNSILGFDLREVFEGDEMTILSSEEKVAEKVKLVKSCLRCHATWPMGSVHPLGKPHHPVVDLNLGVSCQGCHGPASKWNGAHSKMWWRRVSNEAKSKLGFIDLRDSVVKAEVCTSCHVGSAKEERFVRHEWYAAGHPPLPGFELASFSAQMPAHWKPLREKEDFEGRTATSAPVPDGAADRVVLNINISDADIKPSYQEANFGSLKPGPFADQPRTREVLVSAAVVLRSYVNLAGDHAAAAAEGRQAWPEFALYDCAACHHELRRREGLAARPMRRGPPGRPPFPLWPSALFDLAAQHLVAEEPASEGRLNELRTSLHDLERAYTARPFGDAKQIAAAANKLAPQLDALCGELGKSRFDDQATRRALTLLVTEGRAEIDLRDYSTARQVAWAIRELSKDEKRIPYEFGATLDGRQQQALEHIESLFRRDNSDPLMLSLPARQDRFVVDELPASLKAMMDYDAEWFRKQISLIGAQPK